MRERLAAGGRLLALGNGGSATDAMDVAADFRAGDVLPAISTSGGPANVIAALAEGRRRGMTTLAMVGYDGGRILAERLADFVIVTRSEHLPRIQEAQATAYHALLRAVTS